MQSLLGEEDDLYRVRRGSSECELGSWYGSAKAASFWRTNQRGGMGGVHGDPSGYVAATGHRDSKHH